MTAAKDGIAGGVLLALAGGYWWLTRAIPESSLSDEVGAGGLPKLLAATLALVACLLIAKSLIALRRAAPAQQDETNEAQEQAPLLRALGFAAIGIGYMFVAPLVGFPVGIAALIIAVALFEREALSLKLVAVAAAGGLGFWLVFARFLGTEQPASSLLAMFLKG